MALGHKDTLKQLVKDPVTGEDVWVEHQPDLAWFKMIVPRPRIEPAPQPMDAVTRLSAILDDLEREELAAQEEQDKAAESAGPSPSGPGEWKETVQSASTLLQDVPAHAGSGQVALQAAQADLAAGDPGTTSAVERLSAQRSVPIPSALLELFNPARHAVRLQAFVDAQLAGLFTGNIRGFAAGIIRVRPRLAGGLGRALAEIAVVACLLLFHQAVVVDDQRAGGHVVQAGAVTADEQHSSHGDQVHVSGALSGACTGKAPGWHAGPSVENLRTGTRNVSVFSSCFGPRPRSTLQPRVLPQNRRW